MLDIVEIPYDGRDLVLANSAVPKAANVLSVQLGNLEYQPDFGVDLKFFLQSDYRFQNESFKAYFIERLTQSQVNVSDVFNTVETLFQKFTFSVEDAADNSGGLIA